MTEATPATARIPTPVTTKPISKAMPDGVRVWLIASIGILLASLVLFVGTVVAGFAYFAEKNTPLWVTVVGVAALLGMGLGFAGLIFVFVLAAVKGRKPKVVRGADPA